MDYNYVKHLYEYWGSLEEHLHYCIFPRILYFFKIIPMKMKINGNWDINTQKLLLPDLKEGSTEAVVCMLGLDSLPTTNLSRTEREVRFYGPLHLPRDHPVVSYSDLQARLSIPLGFWFLSCVPPSGLTRWCDLTVPTCPEVACLPAWTPLYLSSCLHMSSSHRLLSGTIRGNRCPNT